MPQRLEARRCHADDSDTLGERSSFNQPQKSTKPTKHLAENELDSSSYFVLFVPLCGKTTLRRAKARRYCTFLSCCKDAAGRSPKDWPRPACSPRLVAESVRSRVARYLRASCSVARPTRRLTTFLPAACRCRKADRLARFVYLSLAAPRARSRFAAHAHCPAN